MGAIGIRMSALIDVDDIVTVDDSESSSKLITPGHRFSLLLSLLCLRPLSPRPFST